MYEFKDDKNLPDGALVVNAKTDWILNNIKTVNNTDAKKTDNIMILDGDREIIGDSPDGDPFLTDLKAVYLNQQAAGMRTSQEAMGYFSKDINGKKYLITYTHVDKMDWILVKAQLYDEVFQNINKLKFTFFLITAGFLLIAFATSVLLSRRFYKPIDRLVRQFVSVDRENERAKDQDEFSYLNEAFQYSIEQLNQYKQKSNSEHDVMKAYFLRKLLVDSSSVSSDEFEQARSDFKIRLDSEKPFLICVVKIDGYNKFRHKFSSLDQSLYLFGIKNISEDWLRQAFICEAMEMKNEYLAFIVNSDQTPEAIVRMIELWKQAQFYIMKYYHISISICISEPVESYNDLSVRHYDALNNSLYRLIYGKSSVITSEMIRQNADNSAAGLFRFA